jgi:hypothetical protein
MKNLLVPLVVLSCSTAALAYPPSHQASSSSLYKESKKQTMVIYDKPQTRTLDTYAKPQLNNRELQQYDKIEKDRSFVDLKERNPRDPAFDLYDRAQEKHEKEPRFSF